MAEQYAAVVIGAGVSGLCTASLLEAELGLRDFVVLESGQEAGGTARTARAEGFICEQGPNGWLDREPRTRAFVERLGLGSEIVRANVASAHRFIYRGGRLHEVKPPPAFLASPLLSPWGRLRLLCEPLIATKSGDDPESIYDFAKRRIGREAADILVSPMVSGIFAGDPKQLSLAQCFPRMQQMEREHGSLYNALRASRKSGAAAMGPGGVLHSLRRGMGSIGEAATEQLGSRLHLGRRVVSLARRGREFLIETESGPEIETPAVIVAAPAYAAANFCIPLGQRLADALAHIAYANITVICLGYAREDVAHGLNGFGFLIPRTEGLRALGCLWDSTLFPGRAPEDRVLLRVMVGGATDPEGATLPDGALLDLVQREIHPLLGIEGAPVLGQIHRWTPGIPQYLLGHGLRVKAIEDAERDYPGLIFAGNAYRGVGLNDCVAAAHRAAERVQAHAACQ